MSHDNALTQKQAAAYLGISPDTLRTWRRFGRGPKFVMIGKKCVRYRLEDLEAYRSAHVVDPEAATK